MFNNIDKKVLVNALNMLSKECKEQAFIALNDNGSKLSYVVTSGEQSVNKANKIIEQINKICDGFGGGNNNFAQGGTPHWNKKDAIIEYLKSLQ